MQCSIVRGAENCTLGRQNNLSTNKWLNIGEQILQAKTQKSYYTVPLRKYIVFEDTEVHVLDRANNWFVKEVIYVKTEQPSLIRGGGLCQHLYSTFNAVLPSLLQHFDINSHL